MRLVWLVAGCSLLLLGAVSLLLAPRYSTRVRRVSSAAAARWREMHTPGAGRVTLPAGVLPLVGAMRAAGLKSYRFTPKLEGLTDFSPFLVEASWPIAATASGSDYVGFADELAGRPSCKVLATAGDIVLAHCGS